MLNSQPNYELFQLQLSYGVYAPTARRFSYILSALDGVSCCILRAFCTKKLYAVQRGKGSC